MIAWVKAWWQVYVLGVTTPPEGGEKSIEELLKGYDDEEWEEAPRMQFGDFCYIDTQRESTPTHVFIRQDEEDIYLVDRNGMVNITNGGFVVRWEE